MHGRRVLAVAALLCSLLPALFTLWTLLSLISFSLYTGSQLSFTQQISSLSRTDRCMVPESIRSFLPVYSPMSCILESSRQTDYINNWRNILKYRRSAFVSIIGNHTTLDCLESNRMLLRNRNETIHSKKSSRYAK